MLLPLSTTNELVLQLACTYCDGETVQHLLAARGWLTSNGFKCLLGATRADNAEVLQLLLSAATATTATAIAASDSGSSGSQYTSGATVTLKCSFRRLTEQFATVQRKHSQLQQQQISSRTRIAAVHAAARWHELGVNSSSSSNSSSDFVQIQLAHAVTQQLGAEL
jgi:hypothetical protein